MLVVGLRAFILLGYCGAIWWLLRREAASTLIALVALCGLALSLRLVYVDDFPAGLNEDEPKQVEYAEIVQRSGQLFGVCVQGPCLLSVLFQTPLVPVMGVNPWPIRLYSLVTSVLAVPIAFAAARAMGLRVVASFGAALLLAVLPWSVFYGRVSLGGEMVFHQLLLLAALARVIWMAGGWIDALVGGFGLCLLLYDYPCGRAMMGMPLVGALLARGRGRWLCLLVSAVALIGWSPFVWQHSYHAGIGFSTRQMHEGFTSGDPLHTLVVRSRGALTALVEPVAGDWWLSVRGAGVHPAAALILAVLGSLTTVRRGLFLWAGFLGGMAPVVASLGIEPSTHRMLMVFPFVTLAAACALDAVPWRVPRVLGVTVAGALIAVQSLRFYFSPEFWAPPTIGTFAHDQTAMHAAVPLTAHPRMIAMGDALFDLRKLYDQQLEGLDALNWLPTNAPSIYLFASRAASLRPFYENLFGWQRVQAFGRGFLVRLEQADWSWVARHGWTYEEYCNDQVGRAQMPTLVHPDIGFWRLSGCAKAKHVWRGRWIGPRSPMRLHFSGAAAVDTPQGRVADGHGFDVAIDFVLPSETEVTVTLESRGVPRISLLEVTPAGAGVPPWERVSPALFSVDDTPVSMSLLNAEHPQEE